MKKTIIPILCLGLLLGGCASTAISTPITPVVAKVDNPSQQEVYIIAGKIDTLDQANVSSKIPAKVTSVNVDIGTIVKQGDPLITLDSQDVEAQVNQAQTAVSVASANLEKAKSGSRPEEIEQAKANLENAQKNYDTVNSNTIKVRESYQNLSVTKTELDTAESALSLAASQLKVAQEKHNILTKGETKESLNVYQAQLNQSQASLELTKTQLNNLTITAPCSGKVIARNIQPGELAQTGQTLLTIMSDNNLVLNAYAPVGISSKLKIGQPVVAKIAEISDKKFTGKIDVINPVVDSKNKNVLVKILLDGNDSSLKPGMIAEIALKQ